MNTPLRAFAHPAGVHNATPPRVVFGPGSVAGLPEEIDRLGPCGARRALVITTPGRAQLGDRLASAIGARCAGLLPEAVSQVPIELARRGREKATSVGADCLVAVGGGAATGLAKGIALESGMPIIAVPTTYCGSEMTGFCGITSQAVKRMHQSLAMRPSTVIYDAELSVSLPPQVSAASALNALAHCVDAVALPSLSPLLAPAAVEGARIVTRTLPGLLAQPDNLTLRNEMLYGAYLSGAALTGGFGLQHAVAHTLGGSFGVDHGVAHAVVLPYVTAHLVHRAPGPLGRVAAALGVDTDQLPGHLWDLVTGAELPVRLDDLGLGPDALERAVRITLTAEERPEGTPQAHPDTHDPQRLGDPAEVTESAVRAVLTATAAGTRPGSH
ncbi:iron-containing alcohol dehydrogenase [Streptomyces sp. NPDC005438]|uniref:iron-containing alcohol dehydrogenase n=1 Tax=Streptomyces sp. NPDC005438 TaxID=3156880 RepID=UPI0033A333F2